MTLAEKRERRAARKASDERIKATQAATRAAVAAGACPDCGRSLTRNLALTGWWQCSQYGAEGFRADSSQPACSWQGFTR